MVEMVKYRCQKCGKTWYRWAYSDIYNCSGKLGKSKQKKMLVQTLLG